MRRIHARANRKQIRLDVVSMNGTRAPYANPAPWGGVLRCAAAGPRKATAPRCLDPPRRAAVAPRSLRSLVRPHHPHTTAGHAFRSRWLPCARVSWMDITSGQTLRRDNLQFIQGDRHDRYR